MPNNISLASSRDSLSKTQQNIGYEMTILVQNPMLKVNCFL